MTDPSIAPLVDEVRRFCRREVDATLNDRRAALPPELLEGARALGLFGLATPERWGGLGLGLGGTATLVAELARADRSLATTVGLHNGLGTRALIEHGSDALRAEWLPRLAKGEQIAAFAATEPGAGSDLTAIRTTARVKGESVRLDGEKSYVTNAALAGVYTVLARSPDEGARVTTLLLVPRASPGLALGAEEKKMGLRASSTCSLHLDGVPLTHAQRLDGGGHGTENAHRALEWGRTLLAAGCLGTARAALSHTLAHARDRRQSGRALIEHGAVRAHVASIAAAVTTIEALLDATASAEARGESIAMRSAALKVLASELAYDACDRTIQVHGALGFLEDAGVALLARDCRVTRIFEGANDVLLVRLGSALTAGRGLPHDGAAGGALEQRRAELVAQLGALVADVRRDLGVSAIQHQPLLLELASADVALHAAGACLAARATAVPQRVPLLEHAADRALTRAARALSLARETGVSEVRDGDVVALLTSAGSIEEVFA